MNYTSHPRYSPPKGALEDFLQEKVRNLAKILSDLTQDIKNREELSAKVLRHTDQHSSKVKSLLFRLDNWKPHTNPTIETRRVSLERQLDILAQEKRREEIQAWQDTQALKKERRTWLKQYLELKQRNHLLQTK